MSELPAEALTYQAVVSEYFLGLRGVGLLLSPLDEEQVRTWERRGIPVAVVCRGLRRGLEELVTARPAGTPPPRSLRAYRFAVEDEWRGYRQGKVGAGLPPPSEADAARTRLFALRERLAEAGKVAEARRREAYREAYRTLLALSHSPPPWSRLEAALAAIDRRLVRAWLADLPRDERSRVGRSLTAETGPRPRAVRPRAYREELLAHLADRARHAGVLQLRDAQP